VTVSYVKPAAIGFELVGIGINPYFGGVVVVAYYSVFKSKKKPFSLSKRLF